MCYYLLCYCLSVAYCNSTLQLWKQLLLTKGVHRLVSNSTLCTHTTTVLQHLHLQWVGLLSSEKLKHSNICPPPSLRSCLTSSPMGKITVHACMCILSRCPDCLQLKWFSNLSIQYDYASSLTIKCRRHLSPGNICELFNF